MTATPVGGSPHHSSSRTVPGIVRALALPAFALLLASVSGRAYPRMGSEFVRYEGTGPGLDSSLVVVGGWPLPYLLDKPYLSPVGSVSVTDALLGIDHFRAGRFLADALLIWGLLWVLQQGGSAIRRDRGARIGLPPSAQSR